jgi:hypothetical protein
VCSLKDSRIFNYSIWMTFRNDKVKHRKYANKCLRLCFTVENAKNRDFWAPVQACCSLRPSIFFNVKKSLYGQVT